MEVWSSLEEVEEEEVDACGGHLARLDMCFQEGLDNALVVNEKVDHWGVNHVVMCAQPRDCAFKGSYFCIKGRGSEDPFHMFRNDLAHSGDY